MREPGWPGPCCRSFGHDVSRRLAISNGEVILIIVLVAIPIAAIAFIANAGNAFQLDRQGRALGRVRVRPAAGDARLRRRGRAARGAREDELRQMLEAKAYRQSARGETPLDVDAELARLLAEQRRRPRRPGTDPALREEVRQLVVARNERRARQGKEPLDVEAEVDRQLRELENLGQ